MDPPAIMFIGIIKNTRLNNHTSSGLHYLNFLVKQWQTQPEQ